MTAPTTTTITCGCTQDERCEEGQRLWDELIEARDAVREGQGQKKGHKARLNEFARRRDAYHEHLREEA